MELLQQQLINCYQKYFPISPTPYLDIANELGVSEQEVLVALKSLKQENKIDRIGAIIPPNRIGVSTLAAMAVPENKLNAVAAIINAYTEVNHNYLREHEQFNLWFVVIAENAAHLQQVLTEIETKTCIAVMSLPLIEEYFIDLAFQLDFAAC